MNIQSNLRKNEISFFPRTNTDYYLSQNFFIKFFKELSRKIALF